MKAIEVLSETASEYRAAWNDGKTAREREKAYSSMMVIQFLMTAIPAELLETTAEEILAIPNDTIPNYENGKRKLAAAKLDEAVKKAWGTTKLKDQLVFALVANAVRANQSADTGDWTVNHTASDAVNAFTIALSAIGATTEAEFERIQNVQNGKTFWKVRKLTVDGEEAEL